MRFEKTLALLQIKRYFPIFLALLIGFFGAHGINLALAHGGDTNLIHGCVGTGALNQGRLRIIAASGTCNANETPLDWRSSFTNFIICNECSVADLQLRYNIPTTTNQNFDKAFMDQFRALGTNFSGSTFINSRLRGSDLSNTNLSNTNFSNATLNTKYDHGSDNTSNLSNSNLTNANFSNVDLDSANLSATNLTDADFTEVNFHFANLLGATTTGADFTGAIWNETICPDGTNSSDNGNTCEGHLTP